MGIEGKKGKGTKKGKEVKNIKAGTFCAPNPGTYVLTVGWEYANRCL